MYLPTADSQELAWHRRARSMVGLGKALVRETAGQRHDHETCDDEKIVDQRLLEIFKM